MVTLNAAGQWLPLKHHIMVTICMSEGENGNHQASCLWGIGANGVSCANEVHHLQQTTQLVTI